MKLVEVTTRKKAVVELESHQDSIVLWIEEGKVFLLLHQSKKDLALAIAKKFKTLAVNSMPEKWWVIVRRQDKQEVTTQLKRFKFID